MDLCFIDQRIMCSHCYSGYEGQHTCITYDAVNQAYLDARNRIVVSQPKGDWKPEDFASVGELILDISINLARTYGLTYEEIEKGLPLIDTSRTLIREVCPPVFSHVECRAGKYRRLDGLCNNLQRPTWGATNAPFQRLLGPLFADGINAPRISHTGRDLPLSRVVSRTMHPDEGFHDHAGTVMVIAWGQFMDHDYTLTGTPLDPINRNDPEECCKRPPHLKHPYCNEIRVPEDDYFYRLFGVKCIDFVRGFPSPRPGCRLGSRVPFNTLTGAIDGNTVYGVTEKFARKLRTGYGGLLRMNPVFKEYGLRDLLPLKLDIPDEGCTRPNKNMYCFEAGEIRVNEQLVLTVMHTLMAREHNRVANALAEVNPHWDDETLYQEARRINIAEIQHITYNEFLPILLGKDVMEKFGLILEKEGYWEGYDPEVNPDVLDAFAAAAYRFGHSLLPTAVERWSKAHKFIASKRLSDLIRRPYDLYRAGVLDEYVMGLMNQVAQAMDDSITQEVTNHLFKKVGARFGMDLVSFNMQRGREFGLPGYMEFRKFCGLPGAESFQDLFGTMSNETVRKYESIFEHPIDVDLWSGGVSERPLPGSMLGPTFACIIATQFSYSRRGDRFWYELPKQPSTFTPEQLTEIRKARLARVICDNTDIIDTVQLYPMVLPDHELNPRVPCRSGIIPSMDFTKWAEPVPFRGSAKQFITDAQIINDNNTICDHTLTTTPAARKTGAGDEENAHNDSDCNVESVVQEAPNANLITLQISLNHTTLKKTNQSTQDNIINCSQDLKTATDECLKQLSISNEIPNTDTVLKYVYKNDDKSLVNEKSKPHPLNSLRKKRSVDNENRLENITPNESKNAPLIVNYETVHSPDNVELVEPLVKKSVQSGALADFNIETLHAKQKPAKENESLKENSSSRSSEESNESDRSNSAESVERDNSSENKEASIERDNYTQNKKSNKYRNDDSSSREKYEPNESRENYNSRENDNIKENKRHSQERRYSPYTKISNADSRGKDKSFEKYEDKDNYRPKSKYSGSNERDSERYSKHSDESKESRENINSAENDKQYKNSEKSKYSEESGERYDDRQSQKNTKQSQENSSEIQNDTQTPNDKTKDYVSDKLSNSTHDKPTSIQDVDLGDFSFERIKIDDKGQVVTAGETDDNKKSLTLQSKLKTETPQSSEQISSASAEEVVEPINHKYENDRPPVHINDGEIKPVVELNSDNNESPEENTSQALKAEKDESLETLLGTKENVNEKSGEITSDNKGDEKGDVKQEFERIPVNYKHKNENEKANDQKVKNNDESKTADNILNNPVNEGSLDSLKPIDVNYDEHLKFKFDDIGIKLPTIKLPDDVLDYEYEEPSYHSKNDKEKDRFYQYSDELGTEKPNKESYKNHDDESDNDDHSYYGYYGKENKKQEYKKKKGGRREDEEDHEGEEVAEDEEDHEDLYERFVRERFGKTGSFQERSEKLRDARVVPNDAKLYDNVKNILKKTENIQKQAEKSGDPNAGYAWTLEYGENL
ncbi:unnamed protein product [Chilo suppressalis]|uniref:Chorion peroxidase n=1 Tax=Chilo suppressalis TaxID=168631 RepID=A0ABN8B152_CHISP|nr:unnamed protein product [Chilo suppressalis]